MHDDRNIVAKRLTRVLRERISPAVRGARVLLEVERWEVPGEPVPVEDALAATYEPFAVGERFGRPWGTTWFRMVGSVPDEWAGAWVEARVDLGFTGMAGFQSEGLLWSPDATGQFLPTRGVHPHNHDILIGESVGGGEPVSLLIEAASNPSFVNQVPNANSDLRTASAGPIYSLTRAELVVVNPEVVALREDIRALSGLMEQLPEDQPRRHEILRALESMLDRLVLEDVVGSAAAARAELAEVLARPAVPSAHRISAIGHAHIDSAWLWPVRETIRKCARTFSNVLTLMDRDPEFRFGCSQAAQYEWMREFYPSIFERIAQRVAEGRWVVIGGMWVEADTNLAGGEALIRQFTHGQAYFEEHFGVTCSEVWIPDVFGYPANLPQIMSICGIDRFLTQKLSWNTTNRFPHHTFWWEGIDGSTVFTHFPPVETYNATFHANELAHSVRTFNDKGRATRSLMPFGFGDGGGGPTVRMMEQFRRVRDLEGSPRVEIESPEEFFDAAIAEYPDAPRWVGELYFEMHRGTFTSQAGTKAGNRRSELLLREAELWCAAVAASGTAEYPAADLDRLWKSVLFHQFHDILPGSSIGWVHREAEETYERVATELGAIIEGALGRLAPGQSGAEHLANPSPHPIAGVVVVDGFEDAPAGGQVLADGRVALAVDLAAHSVVALEDAVTPIAASDWEVGSGVIDNGVLRILLDEDGLITSMVDRRPAVPRELVPAGMRANVLHLHEDFPNEYDAWDIEEFYRRSLVEISALDSIEVLDAGPLVARVRIARSFRSSTVVQTLELRAGSAQLEVDCEIDWHEQEHLLKVAFPVDVHATEAVREIQFGHVRTPIHANTSWDTARFEVCAHRWVDVSEPGYGVALLNDSKYGYDITRIRSAEDRTATMLRLSLLRGPRYPDPVADQGAHRFRYALAPHLGDLRDGGVVAAGYALNLPVRRVVGAGPGATTDSVARADDPAVVIETVKAADDGSGDVILRCYESWGGRAATRITTSPQWSRIEICDARERAIDDQTPLVGCDPSERSFDLQLRPFQVVTVRCSGAVADRDRV